MASRSCPGAPLPPQCVPNLLPIRNIAATHPPRTADALSGSREFPPLHRNVALEMVAVFGVSDAQSLCENRVAYCDLVSPLTQTQMEPPPSPLGHPEPALPNARRPAWPPHTFTPLSRGEDTWHKQQPAPLRHAHKETEMPATCVSGPSHSLCSARQFPASEGAGAAQPSGTF